MDIDKSSLIYGFTIGVMWDDYTQTVHRRGPFFLWGRPRDRAQRDHIETDRQKVGGISSKVPKFRDIRFAGVYPVYVEFD